MPYRAKGVDLDLILNNISDGISVHDLDWRYIYANGRIAEIIGLPIEEIIGKSIWDIYPEFRNTELGKACERVQRTGSRETTTVNNPQSGRWFQVDIYPSSESITFIARDITEQHTLKLKVESALDQLRLVTDSVPALISYIDTDFRYQFVNRGYESWFNKTNSEIAGMYVWEVVGQKVFDGIRSNLEQAFAGNRVSYEREQHYPGLLKYVRAHLVPDYDSEGNVKGCIALIEDISEQKELQRSQAASEERLRIALQNVPLILTHNDLDLRYTWVANPLGEYGTQDIIGKQSADFMLPDTAEKLDTAKRLAMATLQPVSEEFSTILDGEEHSFDVRVEPRFDQEGNLLGTTTASLDTTAWRKNEKRLAFLARVGEKLSTSLTHPDLLQAVTDLAIGTFADYCSIAEMDRENNFRILAMSIGDRSREASMREFINTYASKHHRAASAVITSGHPIFVPIVTDELLRASCDSETELELAQRANLRSVISVPLESRGEIMGAITFALSRGKHYKPDDVDFARMLGRRIAAAIDNSRLYQSALKEIEERRRAETEKEHLAFALEAERSRLSNLIGSVPGVVYETRGLPNSPDYRIVYVSDTIREWTGIAPADLVRDPNLWMSMIPEEEIPGIYEQSKAIVVDADYGVLSFKIRLKDGSLIDAESHFRALFDKSGKLIGRCGVLMDVTERARSEREREILRLELERERSRLREIMASIPGAVYETSGTPGTPEYKLEYLSPYVEQMLGYKVEELSNDPLFWVHNCPKEYRDDVLDQIRNLPQSVDTGSFTFKWQHENGRLFDVEVHFKTRRNNEGQIVGRTGVIMDVSERLEAQQELNESRGQLTRLISNVPGVAYRCLTSEGWPFQYASEGCYELTGYHASDFLTSGKVRWLNIINPDDLPEIDRIVEHAIANNTSIEVTYRIVTASGEEKHVLDRAVFIRDEQNEIVAFEGIMIDITEIKKAENAIRQANQAKDQFIAALSHELRTPLTPVLTCVEALKEDDRLPEDLQPLIEIIERNIQLEARLIDDLLDLTRIIRGKVHLEKKTVDLHSLLFNAVDICSLKIKEKSLELRLELSAKQTTLICDPARIQQVLWNLVQNAAKFTHSGGTITIKTWNSVQNEIFISIQDSGIGLTHDQLSRIFNAFEQGSSVITRQFGGLGLGLAISQRIVDLHEGRIAAFSDGEGTGATFTVTLPVSVTEHYFVSHEQLQSSRA